MLKIKYTKVSYEKEKEEFERYVEEVSKDIKDKKEKAAAIEKNTEAIKNAYKKAKLTLLKNGIWQNLENTDSWGTTDEEKIKKAIARNERTGSGFRNIENVVNEFLSGKVRAPIVVSYDRNKKYILIGGNTRLMVARALGDVGVGLIGQPVVVLVKLPDW